MPETLIREIGCLHTASSNIAVFESAAEGLPVRLRHAVRPDLLDRVEQAGGLNDDLVDAVRHAIVVLRGQCDGLILTCSSLGPVVDGMLCSINHVVRVDAALADAAVAAGGLVVALCAVETTMAPTTALFADKARRHARPATVEVRHVPQAWAEFRAGREDRYFTLIAAAAERAFAEGATSVALAQVSMTGAAARIQGGPILTGPKIAIRNLVNAATRER